MPLPVNNTDFICIIPKSRSGIIQRIKHDKVEILPFQLTLGIVLLVICFKCKAYQFLL